MGLSDVDNFWHACRSLKTKSRSWKSSSAIRSLKPVANSSMRWQMMCQFHTKGARICSKETKLVGVIDSWAVSMRGQHV